MLVLMFMTVISTLFRKQCTRDFLGTYRVLWESLIIGL